MNVHYAAVAAVMIGACGPNGNPYRAKECLARKVGSDHSASGRSLEVLVTRLIRECLPPSDSEDLYNASEALPFTVCNHPPTGKKIELFYASGCVIRSGRVKARFRDVGSIECCKIDGVPISIGIGKYGGCAPPELMSDSDRRNGHTKCASVLRDGPMPFD